MTLPPSNTIGELVRALLDRGYDRAAGPVLRAIAALMTSGVVAQRLRELELEAARLDELDERLQPDNPVLRALQADMEPALREARDRADQGARAAQIAGIMAAAILARRLTLGEASDQQLATIGVRWNVPDPESVNALVNYVSSAAWRAEIGRYPGLIYETVRNQTIRGITEGWNPRRTAREIRRVSEGLTVAQAENLTRTAQLVSYRDATAIHQAANAGMLQGQIRIATLDDRTCMACIALHGTRMAIGERVDDHHRGRCTSITEVIGRPRSVMTGEEWFRSLPEARQRQIAGDGAFELLQSGRAQLRDFVSTYQDPVFGSMIREASLSGILAQTSR